MAFLPSRSPVIAHAEDHRGFLQAGDHNSSVRVESAPGSPARSNSFKMPTWLRGTNRKRWSLSSVVDRPLPHQFNEYKPPPLEIAPDELDLESTLVEQRPISSLSESSSNSYSDLHSSRDRGRSYTTSTIRRVSLLERLGSVISKGKVTPGGGTLEASTIQSVTSSKDLRLRLENDGLDPDVNGVIHVILKQNFKSEHKRQKLLLSLLTYSKANVNLPDSNGMTALHLAAEECDIECGKILVSFGAKVNSIDHKSRTPLDLLRADASEMESALCVSPALDLETPRQKSHSKRGKLSKMAEFLTSVGTLRGDIAPSVSNPPAVEPFPRVPTATDRRRRDNKDYSEAVDWVHQLTTRYSELERNIHQRFHSTSYSKKKVSFQPDEAISLSIQLHEMAMFQKAGSRILFLDGGGIRGLVQIEILSQLEQKTGRRITELFDWIVGTSTGGIVALGLVYAKKSVSEMRQMYFKMKDEIFGKVRGGMSFNTAGLEALLKKEFTEHICMDDITYPRVLISAVQKEHINLKLHFFNNCFQDEYCKHWPVWKVARYTSAAPVLFGESDEYVDGGILANNPSESGLSKIQDFYRKRGEKLPISLVVSVGSGKFPIKKLGSVDFLFVGSSGLSLTGLKDGTSNLMSLLSYALVETSVTAENCKSRCDEQGIRYFRLNPRLKEVIDSGETGVQPLLAMILQTRSEMNERTDFSNLVLCFHELSEICRKMHAHINGEDVDGDAL